MQAKITGMEAHRASIQQRLLSAPVPVQLQDETIEDDLEDRTRDEEQEDVPIEVVASECDPIVQDTAMTPVETLPEMEETGGHVIPSRGAATTIHHDETREESVAPHIPSNQPGTNTVDVDRNAMPPPPPRITIPL